MEYRILGPLEIGLNGSSFTIKGRKPRALLALLLLHRNEVVPAERLIDDLWGENPPATAANTLQVYVSQLRKVVEDRAGQGWPGYSLQVEPDGLDAERFERLAGEGASALGRRAYVEAAELLVEALALWRGPPLADVTTSRSPRPRSRGSRSCGSPRSRTGSKPTSASAATTSSSASSRRSSPSTRCESGCAAS